MKTLITILCFILFLGFSLKTAAQVRLKKAPPVQRVAILQKEIQITAPKDGQGVSSPITVKGTSTTKTDINLHILAQYTDGEQDLGTFTIPVDDNKKWTSTPINLWLPKGAKNAKYVITATKAGEEDNSQKAVITVTPPKNVQIVALKDLKEVKMKTVNLKKAVISEQLLEMLKADPPKISSPKPNEQVNSPLIIKGTGFKNAPVEVRVKSRYTNGENDLGLFRTTSDDQGNWQTIPINLWAPKEAQNISYQITATQFDEEKGPSRDTRITVKPKQGGIMLVKGNAQLIAGKIAKAKVIKKIPEISISETKPKPADLGPVEKPIIISPTNHSVIRDSRFQVMGTGTPGYKVKSSIALHYFVNGNRNQKYFSFTDRADGNGIWRTNLKTYPVPKGAYAIQYTINTRQIRPEDSKKSPEDKIELSQRISSPKLTHFSYQAPDFPSTGTGQVWDEIFGATYKEFVKVKGEGGSGLKMKVIVDVVRNGVQSYARSGIVDVDYYGKWEWETGWKYTKEIDSFVIKMTQYNPGNNADKSETIVEYRTK